MVSAAGNHVAPCGNDTAAAVSMNPGESVVCKCVLLFGLATPCCLLLLSYLLPHSMLFDIYSFAVADPEAVASAIVLVAFFATIAISCTLVDRKLTSKKRTQTHLSMAQRVFAALSISQAIAHAKGWYAGRSILLFLSETLGFVFIFLPFTAGMLHRLLEPFYILSVPLSSLTVCTIAGLSPVSLIGLFFSVIFLFIGMTFVYLTLLMSYRIYSWLIHRHFVLLVIFAWSAVFVGLPME